MTRERMRREAGAGEPVEIRRAVQDVPEEFVWRGRRFRVRSIGAPHGLRLGSAPGRRLSLQTTNGWRFVLLRQGSGGWMIDRLLSSGGVR